MSKTLATVAAALLLALAAGAHASTNLVVDGTFSEAANYGSFGTIGSGSFGGWSLDSGSIDLINGYWSQPTSASYSIDLDGNAPGMISQSLNLSAGSYLLRFALAGNPDGPSAGAVKSVRVAIDGITQDFTFDTTGQHTNSMGWITESIGFTVAADTTTSLSFASLDTGGPYGAAIGNVMLTAVPEPGSMSLLLAGVGMLGLVAVRRRKSL